MDIQPSMQKKQWDTPSVTSIGSIEQLTGFGGFSGWLDQLLGGHLGGGSWKPGPSDCS